MLLESKVSPVVAVLALPLRKHQPLASCSAVLREPNNVLVLLLNGSYSFNFLELSNMLGSHE